MNIFTLVILYVLFLYFRRKNSSTEADEQASVSEKTDALKRVSEEASLRLKQDKMQRNSARARNKRNQKRKQKHKNVPAKPVDSFLGDLFEDQESLEGSVTIDSEIEKLDSEMSKGLGQVEHISRSQTNPIRPKNLKGNKNWRQAMIYQQILNPPKAKQNKRNT